MSTLKAREVSQAELASVLGITSRTIRELTRQGVIPRNATTGRYVLGDAVPAYCAYCRGKAGRDPSEALDYNKERARYTQAQADRAQLRYDRERGNLVEAEAFGLAWEHVLVPLRQGVLDLEETLPPELAGRDAHAMREIIGREVRRVLGRVSRPSLDFDGGTEDPELDLLDPDTAPGDASPPPGDPLGAADA